MKNILILSFFFAFQAGVFAQENHYADSLKHLIATEQEEDTTTVIHYLRLASYYTWSFPDTAIMYYQKAYLLSNRLEFRRGLIYALDGQAYPLSLVREDSAAVSVAFKSIQLAEEAKDNRRIAGAWFTLGSVYIHLRDFEKGLLYHRKAMSYTSSSDTDFINVTNQHIAGCFIGLNQPDSADLYAKKVLQYNNLHQIENGFDVYQMGSVFFQKGLLDSAQRYYREGLAMVTKQGILKDMANCNLGIANVFQERQVYDSAIYYARAAWVIAGMTGLANEKLEALDQLTSLFAATGNTDSAFVYQQHALHLKDNIYNADKVRQVQLLAFNEELRKQLETEEQRKRSNRILVYALLALLAFTMIIAGIIYRNNKLRQKAYELLKRQKEEIDRQKKAAEIEAALERVRSRSMAMHKSDELRSVVNTLYGELQSLQVNLHVVGIQLLPDQSKDLHMWLSTADGLYDNIIHWPYVDIPVFHEIYKARTTGEMLNFTMFETTSKEFFEEYFKLEGVPQARKMALQNVKLIDISGAYQQLTGIFLMRYTEGSFSDYEKDIIRRFSKVFEQTYTRFLDIQKAEVQAREAQIELALERVRAKVMAMQDPTHFEEVISVMGEQFIHLDFEIEWVNFGANGLDVSNGIDTWNFAVIPGGNPISSRFFIPYFDHSLFREAVEHLDNYRRTGNDFFEMSCGKEDKDRWLDHLYANTIFKNIPEEFKAIQYEKPGYNTSNIALKDTWLSIGKFETLSFTEEQHAILRRFGNAFGQAYTRFLDLQKAEAQAREAQVEAALERVRAASMAMHKSEELHNVIQVVANQIFELGINYNSANFTHVNDDMSWDFWVATPEQPYPSQIHVPYSENKLMRRMAEMIKKNTDFWFDVYTKEEKDSFFHHFFENTVARSIPDERKNYVLSTLGMSISSFVTNNIVLNLAIYKCAPYTEEENKIFSRFAKVFDQTYTRFLDLQKAEAQAREAKIETALEKVRSRTMAMQKSEELADVAYVLFEQLNILGVNHERINIGIVNEQMHNIDFWVTEQGGRKLNTKFSGRISEPTTLAKSYNAWKSGAKSLVVDLMGEDLSKWLKFMDEEIKIPFNKAFHHNRRVQTAGFFSKGMLIVTSPEPLSVENISMLEKFAGVFDLTYTRFSDLKQAEVQAREAQIETSLERVRSRTMAMHSSQDVDITVTTLFDELLKLGVDKSIRSGIGIMDKSRRMEVWTASTNQSGQTALDKGILDMGTHQLLIGVQEAWEAKKTTNSYELMGDDLIKYFKAINDAPEYSLQVELEKLPEKIIHYDFFFPEGVLFAFSPTPLSDEISKVFMRFASVFGQTYQRYLDLQKAEAQAREATIEAALERVRGKAMAMHNSSDLIATAGVLFTEIRKLGIDSFRSGVGLLTRENRQVKLYSATTSGETDNLPVVGWAVLEGHEVLTGVYERWLRNEDYFPVLKGELLKTYYQKINSTFTVPVEQTEQYEQYGYFLSFSEGVFYGWSEQAYKEDQILILHRFKAIVDLTFRRYLELQRMETIALEALRSASLDRVRAEIASMRTTNDLEHITPLIWKELTTLNIPFIRCGVFIMDEHIRQIHTFLSTPDGKAIAAFHLSYDAPGRTSEILASWEVKQMYIEHWNENAFSQLGDLLVQQGALPSKEIYLKTIPSGGVYLHCLPFIQGMLYVGNTVELSIDEIHLIQSVADTFSTAYARYEDFVKLEQAKAEVDSAMSELKATQSQLVQQEKLASLGQLTAGIAHEIKNPLNFVNNFSEVSIEMIEEIKEERAKSQETRDETLVDEILEDIQSNLGKIHEHGSRANGIVTSMLQHSRGGSGKKEPTDLNALIKEYVNLSFHGMRAGKNPVDVDIVLDLDPEIKKFYLIKEDFTRVIINLCNNAFDAMRQKTLQGFETLGGLEVYHPKLTVRTKAEKEHILIEVEDNGPGIPEDIKDKILQPFFTTKKGTEGTGLGLSITHDIIKAHGGELKVKTLNSSGAKTVFIIYLPI